MYQTSEIRKGLKIEEDGYPWLVIDFQFVKPGKGTAFTRTKLKNLITGNVVDRTYKTGEALTPADVTQVKMQYMYNDDDGFHFMNLESFDTIQINDAAMGTNKDYLLEQMEVDVLLYKERPVSIEVPTFIEVAVQCDPGVKGNTAQGGSKLATLPSGATIQVPLFLEDGTTIKIDTRTGEYVGRVS